MKTKLIGALLFVFIILMIPFVSLLGENDRSITAVQAYFDNIMRKDFVANEVLCSKSFNARQVSLADNVTQQFSLETALLNHFKIGINSKYSVKAKRNRTWLPFMGNDALSLSLELVPLDESESAVKHYFQFGSGEYLPQFMTLIREEGRWKIDEIHVEGSVIQDTYSKALAVMREADFLNEQGDAVVLHEQVINLKAMGPIEKRIMVFNLNKLLTLINGTKGQQ